MAPIFSAMKPRRIPLSILPDANVRPLTVHDIRTDPYARQLYARLVARNSHLKPGAPTLTVTPGAPSLAVMPVRKSSLGGVEFSLPVRVGQYELQKPWVDEVDWYEVLDISTGEKMLCKVQRTGDVRGAEVALAESRLAGFECSNPVKAVVRQSLPLKVTGEGQEGQALMSQEVSYDFVLYPYLDYVECLHTLVQSRKVLGEGEARQLFREICDIVRAGHGAGVALRDLKLRRLVWRLNSNRSGGLMLSHLENCSVFEVDGGDEGVCENQATPSYVSPEMCSRTGRDKSLSLCKVDIWCLGVILFAMVVGRYPFYDTDVKRMMVKVAAARLDPLPGHLSPELRSLLGQLLERDPCARPDIGMVLEHQWVVGEVVGDGGRCVPEGV